MKSHLRLIIDCELAMANDVFGFGVLHSWSRRISRSSSLKAVMLVIIVAALVALDVVRNSDDVRSVLG